MTAVLCGTSARLEQMTVGLTASTTWGRFSVASVNNLYAADAFLYSSGSWTDLGTLGGPFSYGGGEALTTVGRS